MKAQDLVDQLIDRPIDEAIPQISAYHYGRSGQARPNAMQVTIGDLTVWFSYKTPIAFQKGNAPVVASENLWGPTTGKHLRLIGIDRKRRMPREEFEAALQAAAGGEVSVEPKAEVPEAPETAPEAAPEVAAPGEEE